MVLGGKTPKSALFGKKSRISQNSDFLQKYQYFVEINDFSEISHFCSFGCENHQYSIGFISFWRHARFPYQKCIFMCEIYNFTFFHHARSWFFMKFWIFHVRDRLHPRFFARSRRNSCGHPPPAAPGGDFWDFLELPSKTVTVGVNFMKIMKFL